MRVLLILLTLLLYSSTLQAMTPSQKSALRAQIKETRISQRAVMSKKIKVIRQSHHVRSKSRGFNRKNLDKHFKKKKDRPNKPKIKKPAVRPKRPPVMR